MNAKFKDIQAVLQLLQQTGEQLAPRGQPLASDADIAGLETRIGIHIPEELRIWFKTVNGCWIGPSGIYGIRPDEPLLDIEGYSQRLECSSHQEVLPISNDGCGNPYILDMSSIRELQPVYFVEELDARYVVASGFWKFVWFLLVDDVLRSQDQPNYWPFDRERVLREDPDLALYDGDVPFPWDVADIP